MKKINLLFSTLVLVLAFLVVSASSVTPIMQAQALSLQTASNSNGKLSGIVLFDAEGHYTVDLAGLSKGLTTAGEPHDYQFFGHDWRLVYVNNEQKVATFWMTDPYEKTHFNQVTRSGEDIYKDGENIWTNGYTKTIWKDATYTSDQEIELCKDGSDIRKYLIAEAENMLANKDYAKYVGKVRKGYVPGSNEDNDNAKKTVEKLVYAKSSTEQYQQLNTPKNQLTAYYSLNNDALWLPSVGDLLKWEILIQKQETTKDGSGNDVTVTKTLVSKPNTLKWIDTTKGDHVWLRNANPNESHTAVTVSAREISDGAGKPTTYFHYRDVKDEAGVRPAIHLDISHIDDEYEKHVSGQSAGWWNDNWLKVLFMTICIVGVTGLILVVIGVVVKVRNARKNHEL